MRFHLLKPFSLTLGLLVLSGCTERKTGTQQANDFPPGMTDWVDFKNGSQWTFEDSLHNRAATLTITRYDLQTVKRITSYPGPDIGEKVLRITFKSPQIKAYLSGCDYILYGGVSGKAGYPSGVLFGVEEYWNERTGYFWGGDFGAGNFSYAYDNKYSPTPTDLASPPLLPRYCVLGRCYADVVKLAPFQDADSVYWAKGVGPVCIWQKDTAWALKSYSLK